MSRRTAELRRTAPGNADRTGTFPLMPEPGRNDPCFCGSGAKYKRCCLETATAALRLGRTLEGRVLELGEAVRAEAMPAWRAEFARRVGPLSRFGTVIAAEAAWFDTWLVLHGRILDGDRTPLETCERHEAVDALLERCAIGGWWARGTELPLHAAGSHAEADVLLHGHHDAFGELDDGALVIACTAPVAAGHRAIVGRPVVVDPDVVDEVLVVLASAPEDALLAALRWPEEREFTAEGDLVQQHFRRYALPRPAVALELLRGSAAAVQADVLGYYEDDVCFHLDGPVPGEVCAPDAEPGVIWELCDEDRRDPPQLGEVTVSPADEELSLSAPSARRMDALIAALPAGLDAELDGLMSDDVDVPDVLPRVRRERLAAFT